MTCGQDRDVQCFRDCPGCYRARNTVTCTGCQSSITEDNACYEYDGDKYCSDCIEEVLNEAFSVLPLREKMYYFDVSKVEREE